MTKQHDHHETFSEMQIAWAVAAKEAALALRARQAAARAAQIEIAHQAQVKERADRSVPRSRPGA